MISSIVRAVDDGAPAATPAGVVPGSGDGAEVDPSPPAAGHDRCDDGRDDVPHEDVICCERTSSSADSPVGVDAARKLGDRFADLDGDPRSTVPVANDLIARSYNSDRARQYDWYQWKTNGIMI